MKAGRSQRGNNNAYAQDNEITWVDWQALSPDLIDHTAFLAKLRQRFAVFGESTFFSPDSGEIEWLSPLGDPMRDEDWNRPDATTFAMVLKTLDRETDKAVRLAILFNRSRNAIPFTLKGEGWKPLGIDFGRSRLVATPAPSSFTWVRRASFRGRSHSFSICFAKIGSDFLSDVVAVDDTHSPAP